LHRGPEPLPSRARWLHDVGTLALLALILIPFYLLLNQYWKSVLQLIAVYGLLGIGFFRLGRHVRRVMRRSPAEIPPWQGALSSTMPVFQSEAQFGAAEAIQSVCEDPYYLQDVMKPRLRQLLVYRINGMPETSLDALTPAQLARLDQTMLDFLQRRNATGPWARYRYRWQRLQDVLRVLRHLEAL
jgi:hypothetical protein